MHSDAVFILGAQYCFSQQVIHELISSKIFVKRITTNIQRQIFFLFFTHTQVKQRPKTTITTIAQHSTAQHGYESLATIWQQPRIIACVGRSGTIAVHCCYCCYRQYVNQLLLYKISNQIFSVETCPFLFEQIFFDDMKLMFLKLTINNFKFFHILYYKTYIIKVLFLTIKKNYVE